MADLPVHGDLNWDAELNNVLATHDTRLGNIEASIASGQTSPATAVAAANDAQVSATQAASSATDASNSAAAAAQSAASASAGGVPNTRTVNGHALSSDITLTPADIGSVPTSRTVNGAALSSDVALAAADVGAIPTGSLGVANGVATLGADGTLITSQLPALALVSAQAVASEAAMLALSNVQPGDIAVRTDGAGTFILTATPASTLANWTLLNAPTDKVVSVNGQTGTVNLAALDVGALASANNLSDLASAATARTNLGVPLNTDGKFNASLTVANTTRLVYSGSSYPARPTGVAYVEYVGAVAPTTQIAGDTWIDTSGS